MRLFTGLLTTFGLLLTIVFLLLLGYGRASLPTLNGTVVLEGPAAPLQIARDSRGIPHISAESDHDLFFAMGYVHAQDRLWQMEMNRRIGRGRVSELVGSAALTIDKTMRTFGFAHKAEAAFEHLDSETRTLLTAYAQGVNSYILDEKTVLPPEFLILGTDMAPWTPVDTLVWQKLMWLDLSGNMSHELARAELFTRLSGEQVSDLYPAYPGETEPPLPNMADIFEDLPIKEMAAQIAPVKPAGYGSNNWVVDGSMTTSGKPLLANDPHLGLSTPSIWYLVRLHNKTSGANLVGVSFPGSPSVILGRTNTTAWGFTNTSPDTQDLFIEKILDGNMYLTPTGPAPLKLREEIIQIKGEPPVTITVRETRHGPIVSDVIARAGKSLKQSYALALQWVALEDADTSVTGILGLGRAKNFEEFKAFGRPYTGPQQNMVYADTSGTIGYVNPGRVPIRKAENKIFGRLPSPGWDSLYDWDGYIPLSELPVIQNPEAGHIATANERITPEGYPYYITRDWALPYRAGRIRSQLVKKAPHTAATFSALQADTVSDMARDILPFLRELASDHPLVQSLDGWNGNMAADRPEPLLFQKWLQAYHKDLIADELGDLFSSHRRAKVRLVKSSLYWSTEQPDKTDTPEIYYSLPPLPQDRALSWCDNTATPQRETCKEILTNSLNSAWADGASQNWGDIHQLSQTHRPFSDIPILGRFFTLTSPQPGGRYTVNVAGVNTSPNGLFSSSFGPSYRGIFDLDDLDNSLFIQPTGQSGHPLSPHFDDMFEDWLKVKGLKIPTKEALPSDRAYLLTITPKS